MTFVSYSQNFEDVVLWRALGHIERGFYVDIGAQDPVVDSVSLAFYERGWRGVHVEPISHYAEALRQARPGDIVEEVAVTDAPGEITFFDFPGTGLSTGDETIASRHRAAGFPNGAITVAAITLDQLLDRCSEQTVHWMKLDVEGFEHRALLGWRESRVRPWILVIESTRPLLPQETFQDWEPLVQSKGYHFAYFDGLNRYYVHETMHDLCAKLSVPPSVFDNFTLNGTASNLLTWRMKEALIAGTEREARLVRRVVELEEALARLGVKCAVGDDDSVARAPDGRTVATNKATGCDC